MNFFRATFTFQKFVDTLVEMAKLTAEVSGNRSKKLEILKKKLSENHDLMDLKVHICFCYCGVGFDKCVNFVGTQSASRPVNPRQKYSGRIDTSVLEQPDADAVDVFDGSRLCNTLRVWRGVLDNFQTWRRSTTRSAGHSNDSFNGQFVEGREA